MATENTLKDDAKGSGVKSQSCCLGLLLLTETMQQRRSSPMCVGIKQKNDTTIQLPDIPDSLRQHNGNLQFMCLGYSIYEQADARDSKDGRSSARQTLPYCEGVEVVRAEVTAPGAHGAPNKEQAASQAASVSRPANREPYPFSKPPLPSPSSSQQETGPPPLDWSDFAHRYLKSAQRTLVRMQLTWDHMYGTAFKPLVDKVMGNKDDKPS